MSEEKKVVAPVEIEIEDELANINGGAFVDGGWKCEFCGKLFSEITSNAQIAKHYNECKSSPFCGKLKV